MSNRAGVCVLTILLLVGCVRQKDPYYCPGVNSNDNCAEDAGPIACTSNEPCREPTAVCDITGSMTCVQCTPDQASACGGATPACGEDRTCRACRAHAECPGSDACLPDGSCGDPGQIAYVQQGGTGTPPCTRGAPCGTLQQGIDASRPYIKISAGTLADNATTTIDGTAVTLLADPGAKLDRTGDGRILLVRSAGANVSIYDLEITGQTGLADEAIQLEPNGGAPALSLVRVKVTGNQGRGIATGGSLTVSQSSVSANQGGGISATGGSLTVSQSSVSANTGGGISTSNGVTFDITNNLIFRNGNSTTATVGGLSLAASAGANVFAFNTVVDNQVQNGATIAGGILCDIPGFAAANNIIARNFVNNDPNQLNSNTNGLCTYPTSAVSPTVSDLNFVSPDNAPHNYRIMRGSSAIDQATTPSNLSVDIDGDPRPQGNDRDQGADEVL